MTGCALTIVFICGRIMKVMNRKYRGRDYPTDVLSFSYGVESDEGTPFIGDIVIAVDVACSHARALKIPADREMRRLIVHGVLHLLGYDHETDSGEMARLQARLIRRRYFGAGDPVIENGGRSGAD